LKPLYLRPWFVATQGALTISFIAAFAFIRINDKRGTDVQRDHRRNANSNISNRLAEMDSAVAASDASRFFQCARAALQQHLATRWHVEPASITVADIDERLNGDGADLRRIFATADQSAYSGQRLSATDLQQWKAIVVEQLKERESL
jgi:hypothetical protein